MNSPIVTCTAPWIHDGKSFFKDKALIINHEGQVLDMIPLADAGEHIRRFDGVLCPGFINAHCHLELSHLKGDIPEHTGLVDFLIAVLQSRNNASREIIMKAAETAETYMLENGVVAVGDIANKTDTLGIKQKRHLHYHTFVEALGMAAPRATGSMQYALETYRAFQQHQLPASIVPHAPYSVSADLFHLINDANTKGIISIHNQESGEEDRLYQGEKSDFYRLYHTLHLDYTGFNPSGKSSLQSWLTYFTHRQKLILVHNTYTPEADIQLMNTSAHDAYWCLCPNANAYIENAMPPVELLLQCGSKIILGTDSLASNHQLSILEEMKTLQKHFPKLSLEMLLRWATQQGAEALDCQDRFGSFEQGKYPGIVHISSVDTVNGKPQILKKESVAQRVKI